jgi:hypothetical protein
MARSCRDRERLVGQRTAPHQEGQGAPPVECRQIPTLQSSRLKLARAQDHYASLSESIDEYVAPLPPPAEAIDDAGLRTFSVPTGAPYPPVALALILGDFVQNLRAALDHAVFEMSASPGNKETEFPIFLARKAFEAQRSRKIGLLSDRVQRFIEEQQPFSPEPPNLLWRLHELARTDRHRTIPLLRTYFRSSHLYIPADVSSIQLIPEGILGADRPGTVLWRVPNNPSLRFDFEVQVRIDRGPGYHDQDVLVLARSLADKCTEVVAALEELAI